MIGILGFFTSGIGRWLVLALIVASAIAWGCHHLINVGRAQVLAENQAAALKIITKQGQTTTEVVNRYIKVKGDTETVTNTVEKEVVKYAETNTGMCIDSAWVRVHNDAAANAVPKNRLQPDDKMRAAGIGGRESDGSASPEGGYLKLRASPSLRGYDGRLAGLDYQTK